MKSFIASLFLIESTSLSLLFAAASFSGIVVFSVEFSLSLWLFRGWVFVLILFSSLFAVLLQRRHIALQSLVFLLPIGLFTLGYFSSDHFLFKPSSEVELVSLVDLDGIDIRHEIELMVLQGETEVIAFPIHYFAPEAINVELESQWLTYTYCGLSNLGMTIQRGDNSSLSRALNLGVLSQNANNLLLYDIDTQKVIQQIKAVNSTESQVRQYPSFRMTYGHFKRAFPGGRIYFSSVEKNSWWEQKYKLIRMIMLRSRLLKHNSANSEDFAFPLAVLDHRLHPKTPVYGISIGEEHAAFTKKYILDQGGRIDRIVGGKQLALVYHPGFDTIGAYYASSENKDIDIYGHSGSLKLNRVESFKPAVLWGVWQHFFEGSLNDV